MAGTISGSPLQTLETPRAILTSAADRGEHCQTARAIKPPPDVGSAVISKRAMIGNGYCDSHVPSLGRPVVLDAGRASGPGSLGVACNIGDRHDCPERSCTY